MAVRVRRDGEAPRRVPREDGVFVGASAGGRRAFGKEQERFRRDFSKTTLERVNALTPLDLNERLVVNPTSSEALALAIADELGSGGGIVAGADVARSRTSQTKARLVNLAIGV